jgi:hypothetical protein
MSFTRKTFDTDSIVLKTIIARTPTDQSIPAGKVLVAQGDGSTAWLYPSTLPGVPAFTRVIGNGTEIVADNLSSAIVFSTLDSMGMIVNSTTKQISLYAKAFTTIDISGGNSVTAYNTTNNTFTPTVELVGNSGIQISSDPQTNKIYFQTAPPTISTGIYGYQQVNVISNAPSTITDINFSTANTYLTALSPSTVLQLVGLGDIILQTDVTNNVTYIGISTFTTASFQAVSTATGNVQTTGSTLSTTIGSNTSSLWFSTTTAMNSTNSQFQANFNYINSFYTPLYEYEDLSTFTHSTLANTSLASTFCTIYASSIFMDNATASSITLSSLGSINMLISSAITSSVVANNGTFRTAFISSMTGFTGSVSIMTISTLVVNSVSTSIIRGSGGFLNVYGTTVLHSTLLVGGDIRPLSTNRYDLGSTNFRWRDLYLSSGSIYLSTTKISLDSNGALQYSIGGGSNLPIGGGTSSFSNSFTENAFVSSLTASSITAVNFVYLSSVQDSYYISTTNLDAEEISYSTCFGQTLSTQSILASTINGVNVIDYISTGQLVSTVDSLGTIGYISSSQLTSSITGLGEIGYISSTQLTSSITGLGEIGYISSTQLTSTVTGLGSAGYISSATLVSTISSLGAIGYVSSTQLTSSITGLATAGYVSSTQLTSSITGLATAGYVSSTQLTSSITGLATSGYVSSTQLTSSITGLGTAGYVSTFTLTSSLNGAVNNLGSLGYVSTSMMGNISSLNTSTIQHINSRYDSIQVPGTMTLNNALTGLVVGAINHVSTNAVKYAITNGTFNISSFSNATGVQYNFPLSTVIRSIAFSGKNWLMATSDTTPTNGRLYRSENGISWSQIIVQGNNLPTIINKIIYASTLWYAVGSNSANSNYTISRSTDGSNWTAASSGGFSGAGDSIAYNPLSNRFVAVGHAYTAGVSSPVIRFSDDMGSNWLNTTSFVSTGVTAGTSVFYANNLWLSGFNRTTGSNIKYSTNGSNWTDVPGVFFPQVVSDFAYGNSTWVAVGGSNFSTIRYSGNGTSWSNTSNSFTFGGKGVVWTGSVFAAVGSDPTSTAKVKYSTDGISWVNSLNADFSGEGDSVAYSSNVSLPTYTLDVTQGARLNRLDVPTTATISSLIVSSFQLPTTQSFSSLSVSTITQVGSATISSATISSLGIGKINPSHTLDVIGSAAIASFNSNSQSTLLLCRPNTIVGPSVYFQAFDSASNYTSYGAITGNILSNTAGSPFGRIDFRPAVNGVVSADSTIMNITHSGVGIGIAISTSSYLLDVNSHMRCAGTYIGRSGSNAASWAFNSITTATTFQAMLFGYDNSTNNTGNVSFSYSGAGSSSNRLNLGFYNNDNIMNLLANGFVGIGTTSPTANLQIQQSTVSTVGSAQTLNLANSPGGNQIAFCTRLGNQQYNGIVSTNDLAIIFTDGTGGASNRANFYIGPHSDTQGGIRMTYDGKVGIGTRNPETRLHVHGAILNTLCNTGTTTADANLIIRNALDSGIHRIQFYTALNPGNYSGLTGTNDKAIIFTDGSLDTGNLVIGPHSGSAFGIKVMSNGRVGIGVASPGYTLDVNGSINGSVGVYSNGTFLTSDRRIKENIIDANLDICYSNIKSLPLRRFAFISSFKTTKYDGSQIGFIADEVSTIFPKSVNQFEVDISGYSTINHVNYDQIFFTNFGATQKLIQIVEEHTSTLDFLSTTQQTTEQRFSTLEQQGVSTFMTISSFEGITEQRFSSLEAMFQITQSTCFGLQEEVSTLKG